MIKWLKNKLKKSKDLPPDSKFIAVYDLELNQEKLYSIEDAQFSTGFPVKDGNGYLSG